MYDKTHMQKFTRDGSKPEGGYLPLFLADAHLSSYLKAGPYRSQLNAFLGSIPKFLSIRCAIVHEFADIC